MMVVLRFTADAFVIRDRTHHLNFLLPRYRHRHAASVQRGRDGGKSAILPRLKERESESDTAVGAEGIEYHVLQGSFTSSSGNHIILLHRSSCKMLQCLVL